MVTLCILLAQVTLLIIGAILMRRLASVEIGSYRQGFVGERTMCVRLILVVSAVLRSV